MTDYTPFAEPVTQDADVVRRRTWEELRRIGVVVGDLSDSIEQGGGGPPSEGGGNVYCVALTDGATWTPGVATPTTVTRVPLEGFDAQSFVNTTGFTMSPQVTGDYEIDVRLQFGPDDLLNTWNQAAFVNGVQFGNTFSSNNENEQQLEMIFLTSGTITAGSVIDIRLWPNGATNTGTIINFTWALRRLDVAAPDNTSLEQRVSQLELDVTDLQTRVFDLEAIQQVLLDGVYGVGYSDDLMWEPGVDTPTAATRIPIENIDVISNVTATGFSFTPLFAADFAVDTRLIFVPNQNNRLWIVALFVNGTQSGEALTFNSRTVEVLNLSVVFGAHLNAGDEVDVRLWPDNTASTGTVTNYSYTFDLLGLDDTIT